VKAVLLLEDGAMFEGKAFGSKGTRCGEVVFNTAMTGYQEILTDPSYHEQIITMTYPLIGNYGTNKADIESKKVFAKGFIVKENCNDPSSWRNKNSLSDYLKADNVIGLEGIDTRALVKHIRTEGAMKGIISSDSSSLSDLKKKLDEYPGLIDRDIVKDVTVKKPYPWDKGVVDVLTGQEKKPPVKYKVVAFDFGIKLNILRLLRSHGCSVWIVPARTSAKYVLSQKPDGVFLSNGPGDPGGVDYAIDEIKKLLGRTPIFGICLGHQLLGLALGAKRFKLKFGHHGANHPVMNLQTGEIEITSQNHGFCIDIDSLKDLGPKDEDVEITHINLNDQTLEGFRCKKIPAFCVQYHPEASPGPHDSNYLFERFIKLMEYRRSNKKRH
jgi:carbamoyl-phosphate synthase small subunit